MLNRTSIVLGAACAVALGCAAATPGLDVRSAQLARVPADAEFVAQADLHAVVDPAVVDRWLALLAPAEQHPLDASCLTALLPRARMMTDVMLAESAAGDDDGLVMVSGDLGAVDVASCLAKLMDGPAATPPAPSADGTYTLGEGRDQVLVADVAGLGTAIGTAAGLAVARAAEPAGGPVESNPLVARLRTLLPPGGDVEAFLLHALGAGDIRVAAAGLTLHPGATDRYEAVLLAGDSGSANALSLLVMGVPIAIAQIEAMMERSADAPDAAPEAAGLLSAMRPVLDAVREAFTDAQVTVENDAVRVAIELDPAQAAPTDLLVVAGLMLFLAEPGEPEDLPEESAVPPAVEAASPAVVSP